MDSFEAKIGWRRMRKRENNNYRSVPTRLVIENSKNIQKIKKYHCDFISSRNRLEKAEKERKQKLSFCFVPTQRVIQNSKKVAKKFKI